MKNKEKYAEQVLSFACDRYNSFGVCKGTGEIEVCETIHCKDCMFYELHNSCRENRRKWLESEYIEKPVINKSDRAFLDYLREEYKFVARNEDGKLFAYSSKPYKDKNFKCWCVYDCINNRLILNYNVDFPMIKWEDSEPWKIEDLKKLQVVEEYEKCLN